MKKTPEVANTLVFSYLAHRKTIGLLGMALPIVLYLGALILFQIGLQDSISKYYYTGMRNMLVGALWATGIFLLSYKGYGRADTITAIVAGIAAMGISIFPTTPKTNLSDIQVLIGNIHLAIAAIFFCALIYFSYFLFTKTDPKKRPTRRKLQRNVIYRVCAIVMAVCIVLIAIYLFISGRGATPIDGLEPVFWLEAIALEAFGLSWLTKGEAILKDLG